MKPIDTETILDAAKDFDLLVTVEDGVLAGGAGSAVLEALSEEGVTVPTLRLGLPDEFLEQGTQDELLADVGLSVEGIRASIQKRLEVLNLA